jgi:hypothetical protein
MFAVEKYCVEVAVLIFLLNLFCGIGLSPPTRSPPYLDLWSVASERTLAKAEKIFLYRFSLTSIFIGVIITKRAIQNDGSLKKCELAPGARVELATN